MIFDFGRCIYEPENWSLEGYCHNGEKMTQEEYMTKNHLDGVSDCQDWDKMMQHTCNEYVYFKLYFKDRNYTIRIYDNDIEKVRKQLKAAICSGKNYVEIPVEWFYEEEATTDIYCHVYGGVTTYQD